LFQQALDFLRQSSLLSGTSLLITLLLFSLVFFLLNSLLMAVHQSLKKRESLFKLWWSNYYWAGLTYVASASAAGIIYLGVVQYGITLLIAAGPLVGIIFATCHFYFKQADERTKATERISRLHLATVEALATAIDAKDEITHDHVYRVQVYAASLARHFGLTELEIEALKAGALLHDVGKIAEPDYILNKPGKLTAAEFEKMKRHAPIGAEILSSIECPYPVVPIVRHHHENWNGTGYPDNLRGTEIPLGARILAVVDCFDALTSDRPYRTRLSDEEAIAILMERRGVMYDPLVVDTFVAVKDELAETLAPSIEAPSNVEGLLRMPGTITPASAMPKATRSMANQLELRHAIRPVLNAIQAELATSLALVYLKDRSLDELTTVDAYGVNSDELIGNVLALGTRVSGWVAANGRAIVNTDAKLEFPMLESSEDEILCAALPIRSATETIGVLLITRSGKRPFAFDELKFLETICTKFDEAPLRDLILKAITNAATQNQGKRPSVH
jgi:putative nucleotidyltransferase with HDIG domain